MLMQISWLFLAKEGFMQDGLAEALHIHVGLYDGGPGSGSTRQPKCNPTPFELVLHCRTLQEQLDTSLTWYADHGMHTSEAQAS